MNGTDVYFLFSIKKTLLYYEIILSFLYDQ